MSKEQAKLNFESTLLMLTNELSMVKTMSHCSGATSFEVEIENVKSVSNHLPLPHANPHKSCTGTLLDNKIKLQSVTHAY